jgi:hypothetical protein
MLSSIPMTILEKIFGGTSRIKVMRLFLFNPSIVLSTKDVSTRAKISPAKTRSELNFLASVEMVKKKANSTWILNENFSYLNEFQRLLLKTSLITPQEIIKKISKVCKVKMVILTGLFTEHWEGGLDIMVVGDKYKEGSIQNVMSQIEAEVGREIRYSILETDDFKYRHGIGDRLVRDVIDYPHNVIFDKLKVL